MMDLKLYAMYTRIFRPRLIITIYTAVVAQVFIYSMAVHWFWEKYADRLIDPQQTQIAKVSEKDMALWATKTTQVLGLLGAQAPGRSTVDSVFASWAMLVLNPTDEAPEIRFTQLEAAALSAEQRLFYEGKRVSIVGKYSGTVTSFQLSRYRINCCAADAQPLKVPFLLSPDSKETLPAVQLEGKWVRVIGQIRFFELPGKPGNFRAALFLSPSEREPLNKLVEVIPPPANPYID
jgi:hypothetical protein